MVEIDVMPGCFIFDGIATHIRVGSVVANPVNIGLEKHHHFRWKGEYRKPVDTFVGKKAPGR